MKKIEPLVIVMLSVACFCAGYCTCDIMHKNNQKNVSIEKVNTSNNKIIDADYNVGKDIYINRILDTKPIKYDIRDLRPMYNEIHYQIYWDEIKIGVVHNFRTDYGQPESWDYRAILKNGNGYQIQSIIGVASNTVSSETHKRLREYCLNLK